MCNPSARTFGLAILVATSLSGGDLIAAKQQLALRTMTAARPVELIQRFNADSAEARLVVLLSPT